MELDYYFTKKLEEFYESKIFFDGATLGEFLKSLSEEDFEVLSERIRFCANLQTKEINEEATDKELEELQLGVVYLADLLNLIQGILNSEQGNNIFEPLDYTELEDNLNNFCTGVFLFDGVKLEKISIPFEIGEGDIRLDNILKIVDKCVRID